MISPESSVAFYVGDFGVKFYSVIMFLAIVCGLSFTNFIAKKYYLAVVNMEKIWDMFPVALISALIGARFYYVALDWGFYSQNLGEIFAVYHGGLSIHGALLGGFVGVFCYTKSHKINFWDYTDVYSYGLILGQIIGRFGNFFNIEAFGVPCNLPEWICLYVPQEKRPIEYYNIAYFQPTFLYEIVWNVFVLFAMLVLVRKLAKFGHGLTFFVYLALYSLGRMIIEPFRIDSVLNVQGIHFAEFVSIVIFLVSIAMIFVRLKGKPVKN